MMKTLSKGLLGVWMIAVAIPAFAADLDVCHGQMTAVDQRWDAAGFEMPVKPVQSVVHGRKGLTTSGSQATYLRQQISLAHFACTHGAEDQAALRLENVSKALTALGVN